MDVSVHEFAPRKGYPLLSYDPVRRLCLRHSDSFSIDVEKDQGLCESGRTLPGPSDTDDAVGPPCSSRRVQEILNRFPS